MICIIPYKHSGTHDGIELKYAIRSMQKYFTSLSDVIIVSDEIPSWYSGCHIHCNDIPKRREYSVLNKLQTVHKLTGYKEVLYSMDDVYALQPFDHTLPNYSDGLCGDKRPTYRDYKELFRDCPREWRSFEVHCPMIIDLSKIMDWNNDRLLKTWYGNLNKLPGTEIVDCKLRGEWDYQELLDEIQDKPFFSSHENLHRGKMLEVMNYLYPDK